MPITRRRFFGTFLFGGGAVLTDAAFVEPHALVVGNYQVQVGGAGRKPLRILHLSDLHASECVSLDFLDHAVQLGLAQRPDLVCLTGDYISTLWSDWDRYATILSALPKSVPTFAVLGNHDGGKWAGMSVNGGYKDSSAVRALLAKAGITLLYNSCHQLQLGDWPLTLVGVGDWYNDEVDTAAAFAEVPHDRTTLVLNHNPDAKKHFLNHHWHLMLCGHTHGGQCRLPLIGAPFAPVRDRRYLAGLNPWENRWIYTTRGVGNLHGLRFNCPPEVSLLKLV